MLLKSDFLTLSTHFAASAAYGLWSTQSMIRSPGGEKLVENKDYYYDLLRAALSFAASTIVSDKIVATISTQLPAGVAGIVAELAIKLFVADHFHLFVIVNSVRCSFTYRLIAKTFNFPPNQSKKAAP